MTTTGKVVALAAGFVLGIAGAAYSSVSFWQFGTAALMAAALYDKPCRAGWLLLALGLSTGAARFDAAARSRTEGALAKALAESKVLAIRGCIVEEPDVKSDRAVAFSVRVDEVQCGKGEWKEISPETATAILLAGRGTNVSPVRIKIPELCRPAAYGYRVQIAGLRAGSKTPGSRRSGDPVVLLGHWSGSRIHDRSRGAALMEWSLRLKESLLAGFSKALDERTAKLAAGMTLGDKAAVYSTDFRGQNMRDLFARAGIAHLLAVSGSNVSVLTMLVCAVLTRCGFSRRATLVPALAVVLIYGQDRKNTANRPRRVSTGHVGARLKRFHLVQPPRMSTVRT